MGTTATTQAESKIQLVMQREVQLSPKIAKQFSENTKWHGQGIIFLKFIYLTEAFASFWIAESVHLKIHFLHTINIFTHRNQENYTYFSV